MSALDIELVIDDSLPGDPLRWTHNHLHTCLTANALNYCIVTSEIDKLLGQAVCGISLTTMTEEKLQKYGILGGQQETLMHLIKDLRSYFNIPNPGPAAVGLPEAMLRIAELEKIVAHSNSFHQLTSGVTTPTAMANRIRNSARYYDLDDDLSFLELLDNNENSRAHNLFDSIFRPNNAWSHEIRDVQQWVHGVYNGLGQIFGLSVSHHTSNERKEGAFYADHCITRNEWSTECRLELGVINYKKCWAFESKANWSKKSRNQALVQCHQYCSDYFEDEMNKLSKKYVSIITDARNFQFWYAYWEEGDMYAGLTKVYSWNFDTFIILARVFKTFKVRGRLSASASPRDHEGPSRTQEMIEEQRSMNEAIYSVIIDWAEMRSASGFPIMTTTIGNIEAYQVLGMGSDSVIFEGCMGDGNKVVMKYALSKRSLVRESDTLKRLSDVKGVPRLLYADLNGNTPRISCIVTSMVGRKVDNVSVWIACHIMMDILEVLKGLHDYGYVHNDISPDNIVKVDDKYRLIDFGQAVPCIHRREIAPKFWPTGNPMFTSHNRDQYHGPGDDLESLAYTIAFMQNPNKSYWHTRFQDPFAAQHNVSAIQDAFDDLPRVFWAFFVYAYNLDITAVPNTEYWHKEFLSTAMEQL